MNAISNPSITRWLTIFNGALKNPIEVTHPDLSKSKGQHRVWIVDCLRAIQLHRTGIKIEADFPVPNLELPQLAIKGADTANSVWLSYLLYVLGSNEAGKKLSNVIKNLNPTALQSGINDNPEPWWANELLILHALQSYAFLDGSDGHQKKIDECIDFHLAEIQPDHATNEPWAIHAFASHQNGNITAETLLHAGMVHGGGELTPVAQLILSDARVTLEAKASKA